MTLYRANKLVVYNIKDFIKQAKYNHKYTRSKTCYNVMVPSQNIRKKTFSDQIYD